MRIGTVALGRIGAIVNVGLGDCLIAAQSEGVCPDGSDYLGTLDSGGAAIDLTQLPNYAAEATAAGLGVPPAPTVASLPLSQPGLILPKGLITAPISPSALQTNIVCPAGMVASGGVCISSTPATTSIIPGISNTVLYVGAGALFLMMMMMSGGGRRR